MFGFEQKQSVWERNKIDFCFKKNLVGRVLKVLQRNAHNLKCQVKVK